MRTIINDRRLAAITACIMLAFTGNAWGITIQADADNDALSLSDERWFQYFDSRFAAGLEEGLASSASVEASWKDEWFARISNRLERRPGRGRAGAGRIGQALWLEMMLQDCQTDCQLSEWLDSKQAAWAEWRTHASGNPLASDDPPVNPSPVPLPASVLLLGSALAGLFGFLRRSRKVVGRV